MFDFDNTLAALEREVDWAASRHELENFLRAAGIDKTILAEYPSRNLPLYNALLLRYRRGAAGGVETEQLIRQASSIIEAHEMRGVERAQALNGACALLRALQARGKRLVIVTSNSMGAVRRWLERQQLATQVSAIVGRDCLLPLKPAPAFVFRALELCACAADEAVFVGDSEADLLAARAAQVCFYGIAADSDAHQRLAAAGAAEIFSSPAELAFHLAVNAIELPESPGG